MKTPARAALVTLALALVLGSPVLAQTPSPKGNCTTDEHRQFDFWVGDWEVRDANGTVQGTNDITLILDGCVVQEHWKGTSGLEGESYNMYSAADGTWSQMWVDTAGRILKLEGGMKKGKMVMRGTTPGRDGSTVTHEIAWEALKDGRVKQHWRTSNDGGKAWADAFVGFYAKKGSDAAAP